MFPLFAHAPLAAFGQPSLPPILDDAARKIALQRTLDVLRELDRIRRGLELPPESLGHVLEVYTSSAREVALERERAEHAAARVRLPMTMTSIDDEGEPLRIKPGEVALVIGRPPWLAYRVEEIEIGGEPSRWRVHDIRVGNASQCSGSTHPIPGERFRKGGIMSEIRLHTCQTAMDFALLVEYVGPLTQGEVFEATLVGAAVK